MSELSPDAAALLHAGRAALRPGAPDRERVFQSLQGVLTASATVGGPQDSSGSKAAVGSHAGLHGWVIGGVAAIALGAGAIVSAHPWARSSLRLEPEPRSPTAAVTEWVPSDSPSPAVREWIPSDGPSPSEIPVHKQLPAGEGRSSPRTAARSAARPASDFLQEEVRLLSKAEQQMNDGLSSDALRTLDEHERRFPTGALAEERMAARVQALCALGRNSEARGELRRLAHAYPGSPHLLSARRVCGIDLSSIP